MDRRTVSRPHRSRSAVRDRRIGRLMPCVPRMLRNTPLLRRGALLIRGPYVVGGRPGSRLCGAAYRTMLRIAGRTLHRVRDTKQSAPDVTADDVAEQIPLLALE